MKAAENGCRRRKVRFTGESGRLGTIQMRMVISSQAAAKPITGERTMGRMILSTTPLHSTPETPTAASMAPMRPPNRACDELDGSAKYQVVRFQTTAPTRAARTSPSVTKLVSTMPLPTVLATLVETSAPKRLKPAAMMTAVRGESARVETEVAIALALS